MLSKLTLLVSAAVSAISLTALAAPKPLDIKCTGAPSSNVIYQIVHVNTPAKSRLIVSKIDASRTRMKTIKDVPLNLVQVADVKAADGTEMLSFSADTRGTVEGPGKITVNLNKNVDQVYYSVEGQLVEYAPGIAQSPVDLHCDPN